MSSVTSGKKLSSSGAIDDICFPPEAKAGVITRVQGRGSEMDEGLFFVDCVGGEKPKQVQARAWVDDDDAQRTVRLDKTRLKKISDRKSHQLSSANYAKKLGRFYQSFSSQNDSLGAFTSVDSVVEEESSLRHPRLLSKISTHRPITSISFCPKSSLLAYSEYRKLTVVSPFLSKSVFSLTFKERPFTKCCMLNHEVVAYGNTKAISVVDLETQKSDFIPKISGLEHSWELIQSTGFYTQLGMLSDSQRMFITDRRSMKIAHQCPIKGVSAFSHSDHSNYLFVGTSTGDIHTLDLRNFKYWPDSYSNGLGKAVCMASDSETKLAVGYDSGYICTLDASAGELIETARFSNISSPVSDLSFASTGLAILAVSYESFKCAKKIDVSTSSCSHLANSTVVPSHCRYSRYLSDTLSLIASDQDIFFYERI